MNAQAARSRRLPTGRGIRSPGLYGLFRDWQRTPTQSSGRVFAPETANRCPVLQGPPAERHLCAVKDPDLRNARPQERAHRPRVFSLDFDLHRRRQCGHFNARLPVCQSSANYACSVVACDSWCHGSGYKMPGLLRVETWSTRVNPRTQFAENASHGQASVLLVGCPPACLSNVIVRHRSPPLTLLDGEC